MLQKAGEGGPRPLPLPCVADSCAALAGLRCVAAASLLNIHVLVLVYAKLFASNFLGYLPSVLACSFAHFDFFTNSRFLFDIHSLFAERDPNFGLRANFTRWCAL